MSIKQDRIAERIRIILSELLVREVSDPRLQSITVTQVKIDPELMYARIYVNALGDESRRKDVLKGLESANGFLRREVAKRLKIRSTPELKFLWDTALAEGDKVERLLNKLHIPEAPPEDSSDDDLLDFDRSEFEDEVLDDRDDT